MADRLAGVHPVIADKVQRIMAAMAALGFPMLVTDGLRTVEQQAALYAQGRTTPGGIVTNCDGVNHKSNHQAKDDGQGHAVDCCFLTLGAPSWSLDHPWELYGHIAEVLGLTWGGRWHSPVDRPHVEMP